jgi:hypothetical protein
MKYVVLIYGNPMSRDIWARLTEEQRAAGLQAYTELNESLADSGELVVTEALADPSAGKRVSVTDGRPMTSDGPFAEVKEHLAGFYLIDCDSAERAVEIAAQVPEAEFGMVEVRPVFTLQDLQNL